jgi:hypothetical protein
MPVRNIGLAGEMAWMAGFTDAIWNQGLDDIAAKLSVTAPDFLSIALNAYGIRNH